MQLKAEYKVIFTLREQSRFGWDEGHQRVTALLPVWEAYTKVHGLFFQCILLEKKTDMILQSHVKAKKYMTKSFLLYDDLAALCDAVIATVVGTSGEPVMVPLTVMLRAQRRMKTGWFGLLQRRRTRIFLITW